LAALQLLLKTHKGKIDVIYIDPPYNRGDSDFIYDDNYIDKNDAFRHSKCCSFLSKRLEMAKLLMTTHGTIFISCDDNEQASIRFIGDSIFGEQNFEGHIHWRRRHNQPNDKTKLIGLVVEHILVYAKDSMRLKKFGVGKVGLTGKFSNPDSDPRGPWDSKPWKAGSNQSGTRYVITTPTGNIYDEEWL
jgi:adenine specific DNA methylase Mod